MRKVASPLLVLLGLMASAVHAAPTVAPLSCTDFLARACTAPEQAAYSRGVTKPAASVPAKASCDSLLGRTCSTHESAHFAKGAKATSVRSQVESCDGFLKRPCNSQEKLGFAAGTKPRLALAAKD